MPDFLIIGAQKAGTTSLYSYLIKHPDIISAFKKEIHFFDLNYYKNINWYKSFFPLKKELDGIKLTGEASPQYMFHPHSVSRIKNDLPKIKIILLLRNPVYRSYSHYQHQVRVGREDLSFEDAIAVEEKRLGNEKSLMLKNQNLNSYNYLMYSYKKRSIYYPQVKNVISSFDKSDILIIQSEKFNNFPQQEYNKVLSFLGLPEYELDFSKKYNQHKYPPIKAETKQKLEEFFKPYNEKLFDLIGERYDW